MSSNKILIAGAGPVGLAAALFLCEKNIKPRIIDKALKITHYSKALGVNSRSLTLLEKTGATDVYLDTSNRLNAISLYKNNKQIGVNSFEQAKNKYPFVCIKAQSESEELFTRLLEKKGIIVERGIEVINCSTNESKASVILKHENGKEENHDYDYIFAADGAHSIVRKSLGLKFDGTTIDKTFFLFDFTLKTDLKPNKMHIFLYNNDFAVTINLKNNIWRVISFNENPAELFPDLIKIEKINWQTKFIINNRVIEKFNVGRIYFGGDSAHVHSPVGGRGMNLGIEDAYLFVELLQNGKLNEYNERRLKVVKKLVAKIENFTHMVVQKRTKDKMMRRLLPYILPTILKFANKDLNNFLFGLDHDI